jgi:hypothetical protein
VIGTNDAGDDRFDEDDIDTIDVIRYIRGECDPYVG